MINETQDGVSMQLADAIRNISSMVSNGAECADITSAAAQCAVRMLPGARVVVVNVQAETQTANVMASANAPFVTKSQVIDLLQNSVLNRAVAEPHRVHSQALAEEIDLFPARAGFPSEKNEMISVKAVPGVNTQNMALVIIADAETAAGADSVLMTFSELLNALCVGRAAVASRDEYREEVVRAKIEWERTVDALPEVVCLCDQDGRVVRANRTIERWGLGAVNRVQGTPVHELLHPGCDTPNCAMRDAISPTMAAQASHGYLESAITDERLQKTLIVHTRLMSDLPTDPQTNSRPSAVVVVSDISTLQQAQHELSTLNTDLEQRVLGRTEELEKTNSELAEEILRRRDTEQLLQSSRDELADLSQQLLNAQEDERRNLSRELHDSLGQSLGAIKYSLERVAVMHENPDHGDPAEEMGAIIDSIGRAIKDTRSIAVSLRPPLLDDIGTASAIGWLCKNFAETFGETEFHIEIEVPNADVPESLSTPVYRIVQEALNNVVKHAAAKTVLVALRLDEHVLRLEVLDDGIGFENSTDDTGAYHRLGKIGRLGMRERALNSNGHLTIESWPGEGTKVTGEWSLTDRPHSMEQ